MEAQTLEPVLNDQPPQTGEVQYEPTPPPPEPVPPAEDLELRRQDLDERERQLTLRQQEMDARENTIDRVSKNNEFQAATLDDNYIKHQIIAEYAIRGSDAYSDHPNLTPEAVRALDCMTLMVFVLRNGSAVTGESFAESPDNYDHNKGIELARADAMRKIWEFERYVMWNKRMGL